MIPSLSVIILQYIIYQRFRLCQFPWQTKTAGFPLKLCGFTVFILLMLFHELANVSIGLNAGGSTHRHNAVCTDSIGKARAFNHIHAVC